MANNNPQRFNDPEATLRLAINSVLSGVWTALPGVIESYDPVAMTVSVQPATQGQIMAPDGTMTLVDLPLLSDVPVNFPGGGGCILTFPLTKGDECLVIFASRGIDAWHEYGGVQPPTEARRHALSDAFCIPGVRSKPRILSPPASTTATQLRTEDGVAYVELDQGQPTKIVNPAGIQLVGPVTCTSTIIATGQITGAGINLTTHKHSGVTTGGGTSGPAVP